LNQLSFGISGVLIESQLDETKFRNSGNYDPIVDGTIVNDDINAAAAIAASKLLGVQLSQSGTNNATTFSTGSPTGGSNGGGGAGLSINALYSLLSREGRNARQLQKIIERDYRDAMIEYRFTRTLINRVIGISGSKLLDFKQQYKPGYYFIIQANDYELIEYIKKSYASYLDNPAAYRLQPLNGN
jgi:hypothetical protein